jgi:anti-sigma factor RsiW
VTPDETRELFSAALEGELTPDDQRRWDAALERDAGLRAEYREFVACNDALRQAAAASASDPVPDLLPGVQSRLRARTRGRFYADRFAERSGLHWQPTLSLALLMLALLALCWLGVNWLQGAVHVAPPPPG